MKNDGSHSFTPDTGAVKKPRQLNNVQLTQGQEIQLSQCTQNIQSDKSESDIVEVIDTDFGEIEKEAEALIQYSHWNGDM